MSMKRKRLGIAALALGAAAVASAAAIAGGSHGSGGPLPGPSSSQSAYVVPVPEEPGLVTEALLTTGDSVNKKPDGVTPYRMAGIPDGLGAFDNHDGTFTVLMNHELGATDGALHAHGSVGAFVSKWIIKKDSLKTVKGEDLAKTVMLWNGSAYVAGTTAFGRLCSGDLPAKSALYNWSTGKGYTGRLYMNGEEVGNEGRAWAHGMDGTSWQLPALGRMSWENVVASPYSGDKTVVVGLDDSTPGQVYVYVGQKGTSGSAIDKAGLTGGTLYGIRVVGFPNEPNATGIPAGTRFELADLGNRTNSTGGQLETDSNTALVTRFLRPEDGSFDPTNARNFYFVTTNAFNAPSRLWRLRFDDPKNPTLGGTIEMALDGTEGQQMLDNITVTENGDVLLQEDVGNNSRLGVIWRYLAATDTLEAVARHDVNRFLVGAPDFLTQDEEASGIIPAPFLGDETYLLDVQAHYPLDAELVQGGQLLLLQWMDFDNLADLADRLVSDKADKTLLRELMQAAKDDARGKDRSVNRDIDEFQDELAELLQRNRISWANAARLAELADTLRP
jgi:hypothetical protein